MADPVVIVNCSTGVVTPTTLAPADQAALDAQRVAAAPSIAAAQTAQANQATINQRLSAHRTQLLNWIAANPSGAVLTAAQTLILAQMLIDLTDADLGLLADTTGT